MTLRRDFEDEARKRGWTEVVLWALAAVGVAGLIEFIYIVTRDAGK